MLIISKIVFGEERFCKEPNSFYCLIDNFNEISDLKISCNSNRIYDNLILLPNKRIDLDKELKFVNCSTKNIDLNNFKRFSVDKLTFESSFTFLNIFNSDFVFTYDAQAFVQRFFNKFKTVGFKKDVRYYLNTPKIAFKNAIVSGFLFENLVNSSLMKNYFTFNSLEADDTDLNSTIGYIFITAFRLKINSEIIDKEVFKKMRSVNFQSDILGIEADTFRGLTYLKQIQVDIFSLKMFFHRGTEWMTNLNNLVSVDFNNSSQKFYKSDQMKLGFAQTITDNLNAFYYDFPDEDFCYFKNFPHKHYVFPVFTKCFNSCLFRWLTQYEKFFFLKYPANCAFNKSKNCSYSQMINLCLFSLINAKSTYSIIDSDNYLIRLFDRDYFNRKMKFVLSIVVLPITSILGVVLNILNILVLSNKRHKKHMKDRMYKQMLWSSWVNLAICSIYLLNFTIKCINPIDNFCIVSIVTNKLYRAFLLSLVNYVGNALKTASNLILISISLDRFILLSDRQGNNFAKFKKLKLTCIYLFFILFALLLNTIKVFEFNYDISFQSLSYPQLNPSFFNLSMIYAYFNFLNIFVNNFCLILIQLIIDCRLFKFVHQTHTNNLVHLNFDKQNKNQTSELKIKIMIIINSLLLFVLHCPEMILSIIMATNYAKIVQGDISNTVKRSADYEEINEFAFSAFNFFLLDLSEIFYLLGYSVSFFIYYFFNNVFRNSFENVFIPSRRQ
jgi:hypothetical protein